MLYEMLTGNPPHVGSSAQQIIMKIVTEEPAPVTKTRKAVPPNVAAAVAVALEKLSADRFESAASFGEALTNPAFTLPTHAPAVTKVVSDRRRTALIGAFAALSVLLLLVALWGWLRPPPVAPSHTARFSIALPPDRAWAGVSGVDVAIAPDGSNFVYRGSGEGGQLYRRNIGEFGARPLAGTVGASQPVYSPDGEWLAFVESGLLQRIPSAGGPPLPISDVGSLLGASWGSDGNIVMGDRSGGLRSVAATGGPIIQLTVVDTAAGESSHRWPEILPRGNAVLFTVYYAELSEARIGLLSLESGDVEVLDHAGTGPHFVEGGYLVYGRADGTVVAAPFDENALEVRGPAVPLIEDVGIASGGALELAIARNGSLVYTAGLGVGSLLLIDDRGNATPLPAEPAEYFTPRFSPAGDRVAVAIYGHIWVYDRNLKTLSVRTSEGQNYYPSWSPDGHRIFLSRVSGTGAGLYSVPADGSANPTRLYGESGSMWESEISPDGQWLAFSDNPVNPVIEIVAWESAGGAETRRLTQTGSQTGFDISPDGRWIAYASNQTGQNEVYVTSFPHPSGHVQISVDGGETPVWSPDGRVLYYVDENLLIAATVNASASSLTVQSRNPLFTYNFQRVFGMRHFDVDPQGRGFVVVDPGGQSGVIVVVLDWVSELRERMGH
jgi:serine/threonine-protein kinase